MKNYNNGYDIVYELYHKYGLIEAFRVSKEYLAMQRNTEDEEEKIFCNQMEMAMWKLDQM